MCALLDGLEGELTNIEVMVTMCENCHMKVDHFVDKITKKVTSLQRTLDDADTCEEYIVIQIMES